MNQESNSADWDNYRYPLLEYIMQAYEGVDMSDTILLSCQHLLGPQLRMYEYFLLEAGLKPENCIIVGKGYSTNSSVLDELIRHRCVVAPFSDRFNPLGSFQIWFASEIKAFVAGILTERNLDKIKRIIVLDDGGYMHEAAYEYLGDDLRLVGVEQTSSGRHKIERLGVPFCKHMVASSLYKQKYEAVHIGTCGAKRIISHLAMRDVRNPRILVNGLGTIGRHTAFSLFSSMDDVRLSVTDPDQSSNPDLRKNDISRIFEQRGMIIEYKRVMRNIGAFDAIVGARGSVFLRSDHIDRLHPEVSLISMSSGDIEFPANRFRSTASHVHQDCLLDDRCLVNAGFPITFMGDRHELNPSKIEMTIAQLMAGVFDLCVWPDTVTSPHMDEVLKAACDTWMVQNGYGTLAPAK